MNRSRNFRKLVALSCMLPAVLAAQNGKISKQGREWVEEITGSMASCPRMKVETPGGQVEVRGGSGSEITYRVVKRVRASSEEEARRKLGQAAFRAKRSND